MSELDANVWICRVQENITCFSSGGGSSGGGTTVSKTEPWDQAKPYYETLYKEAENAYNNTNKDPYSGQTLASTDPLTTESKQSLLALIPQLQSNADAVQSYTNDVASGKYMDASSNQYLQSAIDAAMNPILKTFNESTLPSLNSSAIANGAYGGARNGLALGRAAEGLASELADTNAKIAYQNYATERGYQNNLPTLVSAANTLAQAPATIQASVGAQNTAEEQAKLDDAYNQWVAGQSAPWNGISEWASVLNGGGFTNSQTEKIPATNTAQSLLTSALGGGSLAYLAGAGPWGVAAAAGLGALAGGLS